MIKILINGATGKMGFEAVKAIFADRELELVGVTGKSNYVGEDIGKITTGKETGLIVETELEKVMESSKPDILLDLTNAEAGLEAIKKALNKNISCVTGSTGFSQNDLKEIQALTEEKNLTTIIAPNFSIGAILMMKFSQMAGKHFNDIEIIEMHHEKKKDAPSGTAIKTADMILSNSEEYNKNRPENFEILEGSRGGTIGNINIHSVRLPGFVASQEVMFGGLGQVFTIKHQTISREAYMPGLIFSLKKANELKGYIYGLETII